MSEIVAIVGVVIVGLGSLVGLFLVGMHRKSAWALRPVIRFSKAVLNPQQMKTAGTKGAYASIIRHRGRISGRDHETPVGVLELGEGFVIALPYGTTANWVRNVLASGSATIVHEDTTTSVDSPQIVPLEDVIDAIPSSERRSARIFGVDQAMRLRRVETSASTRPAIDAHEGVAASM